MSVPTAERVTSGTNLMALDPLIVEGCFFLYANMPMCDGPLDRALSGPAPLVRLVESTLNPYSQYNETLLALISTIKFYPTRSNQEDEGISACSLPGCPRKQGSSKGTIYAFTRFRKDQNLPQSRC